MHILRGPLSTLQPPMFVGVVVVGSYMSRFSLPEISYLVKYLIYISQNNSIQPNFYLPPTPTFIFRHPLEKQTNCFCFLVNKTRMPGHLQKAPTFVTILCPWDSFTSVHFGSPLKEGILMNVIFCLLNPKRLQQVL